MEGKVCDLCVEVSGERGVEESSLVCSSRNSVGAGFNSWSERET